MSAKDQSAAAKAVTVVYNSALPRVLIGNSWHEFEDEDFAEDIAADIRTLIAKVEASAFARGRAEGLEQAAAYVEFHGIGDFGRGWNAEKIRRFAAGKPCQCTRVECLAAWVAASVGDRS